MKKRLSWYKKIIATTLIVSLSSSVLFTEKVQASSISKNRIGGKDRVETSLLIAEEGWIQADNAILTTGYAFPDALCVSPLAKLLNSPILLSKGNSLEANTINELKKLGVKKVYIIAGTDVISSQIENTLKSMNISIERIYGKDRYETSIKIANKITEISKVSSENNNANGEANNINHDKEVFITTGLNFPDSLSVSSISAQNQAPIILLNTKTLQEMQKKYFTENNIKKAYIIGGPTLISPNIEKELNNLGITCERIYGSDRYETNKKILDRFDFILNYENVFLSTGGNYPDALSGAALASKMSSPILLTKRIPDNNTKSIINSKISSIRKITILGGESVVRDYTYNNLVNNTTITVNEAEPKPYEEIQQEEAKKKQEEAKKKAEIQGKYNSLNTKVTNYLKKQSGTYGFYFINLKNGARMNYNADKTFVGASTGKIPVALYNYELIAKGKVKLTDVYTYTSQDYETGTGSLQYKSIGTKYTVRELLNKSMRISDNVAHNILRRQIIGQAFYDYMGNIIGRDINSWVNKWTPKEMALFMNEVYKFNSRNPELGKIFINDLSNTIFNDRINRNLPKNVQVAHKIGNQVNVMNDVGIVYAKDTYVIAFMSDRVNINRACEVIGEASKMIYDFVNNQ